MTDVARVPVEEREVRLAAHDPVWFAQYACEAAALVEIFGGCLAAVEHFGSTSVPGLLAKPIVDILLGSRTGAAPTPAQLEGMQQRGYAFHGEDGRRAGRWFWRRRAAQHFNVSLVRHASELWNDNLALRDYLRAHADEAARYAAVKRAAQEASPDSMLGYQNGKRAFVEELRTRARPWAAGAGRGEPRSAGSDSR